MSHDTAIVTGGSPVSAGPSWIDCSPMARMSSPVGEGSDHRTYTPKSVGSPPTYPFELTQRCWSYGRRRSCGPVSLLVNNAGVQLEKTVIESTDENWDLLVGVNCRGS